MSLFNTDNVIDEAKLAREAVAALFEQLAKKPIEIDLQANKETTPIAEMGTLVTALKGLRITIGLGS